MWEICYPESLQTLNWENVDISTQCTCENNLTGFIDSTDIRPCIQAERKWDMLMAVILSITSSNYDLSVWITWNTLKKFHSPLGYLSPPSWIPNFNFTAMTRCDWLLISILRQCSHLIGAKVSKLGSKIDDFLAQKKNLVFSSVWELQIPPANMRMTSANDMLGFPVNWRLFPTKTRVDVLFAGSSRANGANNNF